MVGAFSGRNDNDWSIKVQNHIDIKNFKYIGNTFLIIKFW